MIILAYGLMLGLFSILFLFIIFPGSYQRAGAIVQELIAFGAMVFPVFLYFMITETRAARASFGKRKSGIHIIYRSNPVVSAMARNFVKLLPWQLGHMAVIEGLYQDFNQPFVIVCMWLAVILPIIYVLLVLIRKDHRGLPDLIANTVVVADEK